jgi:hypothetical protein
MSERLKSAIVSIVGGGIIFLSLLEVLRLLDKTF